MTARSDDEIEPTPARGGGASIVSRRGLLAGGVVGAAATAAAAVFGPSVTASAMVRATPAPPVSFADLAASRQRAFVFLDGRVDEYGTGTAPRLPRSYQGGFFSTPTFDFLSSFAYDDALVILAYLSRKLPADVVRATALGNALLSLQARDPLADGRTRASYQPDNFPVATPPQAIDIGSTTTATGNQAWVGMAFARLYATGGDARFLDGALRLAQWIQTTTFDGVRAPFGYTGGQDADNVSLPYKSTEHNIDVTAFFGQLALLTDDPTWSRRAAVAASFVRAMQDPDDGHLWTGTENDGVTPNTEPVPEDVQSWAFLATLDHRYSRSVTWTTENLVATDGSYTGPSFSDADTSKVWFEGAGHLALALRARGASGDLGRAHALLDTVETAQLDEPNGDGRGIVAASSDGLDTGFGDFYYASLHTGATAWYLLALMDANPFRF
jgi:hypothetical protein